MYFPSDNPGINPYLILIWCCYFILEECKQIKGSYDLSALEEKNPSYLGVLSDYFEDPWQIVDWARILTGLTYFTMYQFWGKAVLTHVPDTWNRNAALYCKLPRFFNPLVQATTCKTRVFLWRGATPTSIR